MFKHKEIYKLPSNYQKEKKRKKNRPRCFHREFYQTYKDQVVPIPHKLYQRIKSKESLPISFYKASIKLIQLGIKTRKKEKEKDKEKRQEKKKIIHQYHL